MILNNSLFLHIIQTIAFSLYLNLILPPYNSISLFTKGKSLILKVIAIYG